MSKAWLSSAAWKWLICVITAVSALAFVTEARHGFRAIFIEQQHGTLGATLADHLGLSPESQGRYDLPILDLHAGSPLLAYGARPGDLVRYDRPLDRWRRFEAGEPIGLTLIRDGGATHLTVRAVASPVPFAEAFDYVASALMAVSALLFSFLVGLKQAHGSANRALSLTFFALSLIFFVTMNYSPPGSVFLACKLIALGAYPLIWYWSLSFALRFQPNVVGRLRRTLNLLFPCHRVLAFGTAAYSVWYGLGHEAPWMLPLTSAVVVLGLTMTIAGTVEAWRQSTGEMRQRLRWLILSFALGAIPAMLAWIPALDMQFDGLRLTTLTMFAGQFAMYIGLAYAVLKHRIFDFDLAVSRMAVFSVLSILLLSTFFFVKQISSYMLKGGQQVHVPTLSLIADGLVALGIYIAFHFLHERVERKVEHVFFRDWHDNEHRLRKFLRQAAHITEAGLLISSARGALDRFTAQAGCAIYLREPDGSYRLSPEHTLGQAPERIGDNHLVVVSLRSDTQPLCYDSLQYGLSGELALPMCHCGVLNGFILIGTKPSRNGYRPDEVEVLGFAAHQIGLDLHAIRVAVLEKRLDELAQQVASQEHDLQLMAGRRKSVRRPAGAPATAGDLAGQLAG